MNSWKYQPEWHTVTLPSWLMLNFDYPLYSSTCHGRSLGWTATCFGRPLLQCTNYFAMLMSLYSAATCLTRPADSQLLDPVPAKADSDHEWSEFWRMFHEDLYLLSHSGGHFTMVKILRWMSPRISSHSARRRSSPWVSIFNLVYFLSINASDYFLEMQRIQLWYAWALYSY